MQLAPIDLTVFTPALGFSLNNLGVLRMQNRMLMVVITMQSNSQYRRRSMPIENLINPRSLKERMELREGQRVTLLISSYTEAGFVAVINGDRKGILYKNEVFQQLKIGQEIDGFIKKIRLDKKIDLSLYKSGFRSIDTLSKKILETLQKQGGFMAVNDKTQPKIIADLFGVSKKSFKKAIGNLYKKRWITLEKDGIRLQDKNKSKTRTKRRPSRKSRSVRKSRKQ